MRKRVVLVLVALLLGAAPVRYFLSEAPEAWADSEDTRPAPVARSFFGMQAIPKFDEVAHHGAWAGSRDRGLAMHRDLGVQLSREGYIWLQDEPTQGSHPNQGDFDDAIARCQQAGIAVQLMITDTPYWASSAPQKVAGQPDTFRHAPPRNLYAPIFDDGTDMPGPGKHLNPEQYWGCMLERVSARYKGKVKYYQVWNEPDYPRADLTAGFTDPDRSWNGSVSDYVRLLKVAHTVVKWVDPKAEIATGGLGFAPYLKAMLDEGAGPFFDAVDFHAYGGPGSDVALRSFLSVYGRMRQTLRHAGLNKGLICSETGYSAADARNQADYIAKLYATGLAHKLEGVIWYTNTNPSWRQMGLVDWHSMTQRTEGYWAYKTVARALSGMAFVGKLPLSPQLVGYRFFAPKHPGQVIVCWAPFRDSKDPVTWPVPDKGSWRLVGLDGRSRPLKPGEQLAMTATPVILDSTPGRTYVAARPNPPHYVGAYAVLGTAADSSEAGGFHEAGLAIDGDPDTEWVSGETASATADLALSLGEPAELKGVRLKTGPMDGATLAVEVSMDGTTYRPVVSGLRFSDWGMQNVDFPGPQKARWVRFTWHKPDGKPSEHAKIFEIELR